MKQTLHKFWVVFYDFLAASLVWMLFYYVRKQLLNELPETFSAYPLISSLAIGAFWVMLFTLGGIYQDIYRKSRVKEILQIIFLTLIGALVIFFFILLNDVGVSYYKDYYKTFGAYFSIHASVLAIEKSFTLSYLKKLIRKKTIVFNTLIIGSNPRALELHDELEKINDSLGIRFIGYLNVFENQDSHLLKQKMRHFGDLNNLKTVLRRCKIEQVIIAIEPSEHEKIATILNDLSDFPSIKCAIIPDLYHILIGSGKVNHILGVPLIEIKQTLMPLWQQAVKRIGDVVISLLVLLIGFPIFLMFGLITVSTSKGPMFYTQIRIGKNKFPFHIIKFRSMVVNAEAAGPALSSDDDPRITKWGKFMRKTRIDELPQFFNVLKGDMALVGPRPERKYFIDKIMAEAPYYNHVFKVRPGITSLGQVKYGYAENVEQMVRRLKYDMLYIENMTLSMDFRILLTTIVIVIQGRGK